MSKLSKFKSSISPTEGAELLSRLIGEEVSTEDLNLMYTNGWLTASYHCMATLVKLKPLLDPEDHAKQVAVGRRFMEVDKDCGLCVGYDLPLDQVDIGIGARAYVLRDEEGNYYALRDNPTQEYLNEMHDNLPYFEDAGIAPQEIYELAEHANNNSPVEPPKTRIKRNYSCISDVALYNFQPGDDRPVIQPAPVDIKQAPEPPSFVLAVAALIEIATNGKTKKRNQSALIDEILDNYKLRGLSKSNLEKIFSQANRQLTEARAAKD
ncbi:hypothetical protein HX870_01965 [Pseudomonas gingeri]|uniref:hypothetical protein n=1 Tax=Pseudomonas gingeri TaxID=117681 RepID=UPI0015A36C9B|nr:hypothetical protein [Pseudomonas gingeri]NWD66388.1 hypothetical protein [Pseudomonas gingeri]